MIHPFQRLVLSPIIRTFIKEEKGVENIPDAPFVAIANHAGYIDDIIVPDMLLRATETRLHIFVNSRFYKNPVLASFLHRHDCLPVDVAKDVDDDEQRKKTNALAMEMAAKGLKNNQNVLVFPEGSTSDHGELRRGRLGAARLAIDAGVPIVPIGVIGSFEILNKHMRLPSGKQATIIVGEPINPKSYKTPEQVTRMAMKRVGELIGQEYTF